MGRFNLLSGQSNLLGGQMLTQLTCYLPPCQKLCDYFFGHSHSSTGQCMGMILMKHIKGLQLDAFSP